MITLNLGYFGKLPFHGDFLRAGESTHFVSAWDQWLQQGIYHSQHTLGQPAWLRTYLTSPLWRFIVQPQLIDDAAYLGFMIPSVDSVGRYFPFTVYVALKTPADRQAFAGSYHQWLQETEAFVLSLLEKDSYNTTQLSGGLQHLLQQAQERCVALPLRDTTVVTSDSHSQEQQISALLLMQSQHQCLWWTEGSDAVSATAFLRTSLPDATLYTAMLNGHWAEAGITELILIDPESKTSSEPVDCQGEMQAHGATHPGNVRSLNEDQFLNEGYRQLWAVADGMGGHARGDIASYRLIEALAATPLSDDIQTACDMLCRTVNSVNQQLFQMSEEVTGSTLALLYITGSKAVCLWVGDSRIYRMDQQGNLQPLTVDHCVQNAVGMDSHVLTRAVGSDAQVTADIQVFDVHAGDRFLLCSDGVYGALEQAQLAAILHHEMSAKSACQEIMARVLDTAATDNLTAIVVDR